MKPTFKSAALLVATLVLLVPAGCISVLNGGYEDGGQTATTGGGGTTGGSCMVSGNPCQSSADCCSGRCNGVCLESVGDPCLLPGDCTTDMCTDQVCACSDAYDLPCGSTADCCNGLTCTPYFNSGESTCCNQIGGDCKGPQECCDANCVDGGCACQPLYGPCRADDECCHGRCFGGCSNGPGEPCQYPIDCYNRDCVNGTCGGCSVDLGMCATDSDCCSGLTCAANLQRDLGADAGASCCSANGSSCGDAGNCCSGICDGESCICAVTGQSCSTDQACCAGGACTPRWTFPGYLALACCQMDGQTCFSGEDCCSTSCQNGKCACEPAGGWCAGQSDGGFAPIGGQVCCSGSCGDGGVCL